MNETKNHNNELELLLGKIKLNLQLQNFNFVGANGLAVDASDKLISTNNDPQIYLKPINKMPLYEVTYLSVVDQRTIEMFSSYNDDYTYTAEYKKLIPNGMKNRLYFLKNDLKMLRIDPSEVEGKEINFLLDIKPHVIELDNKPSIVLVSHDLTKTGAPLLLFNIAKQLKKSYNVLFLSGQGGRLEEDLNKENIKYLILGANLHIKNEIESLQVEELVEYLSIIGYSKVLLNTVLSASLAKCFYNNGFFVSSLIHEMKTSIVHYNFGIFAKELQEYAHKVIFPDICVKKDFESLFGDLGEKATIQPQGRFINSKINKVENKVCKTILGLGTYSLRKGSDLFTYAALELLTKANEDYEFIWVGEKTEVDLYTWVNHSVQQSEFFSKIKFYEHLPLEQYEELLTNADALWLTSREDPYPSVMIDAIYYQIPVFAFCNTGGSNTMLDHGRGVLIKNYNLKELADQTLRLLTDEEELIKMTNLAKQYLDNQCTLEQYIDLILNEVEVK